MSEEEIINLIYKYNITILNYKNYVKGIYENYYYYSNIIHKGYLIDLKYFKKWKEILSYKKLKTCLNCSYKFVENEIKKYCDFNLINESIKEDQIKYQNSRYLISMILNDNQFIIINEDLYKLICQKRNVGILHINYSIKYMFVYVYLNNDTLVFSHNKNILNIKSFISNDIFPIHQKYFNDILLTSKSIFEYYKFSENVSYFLNEYDYSKLNNKNQSDKSFDLSSLSSTKKYFFSGYFIENKWIEDWRININYDIIKKECKIEDNNYINNNINNNNNTYYNIIIKKIANRLIYESEEKRINFKKINSIKILDIKTEKEIKSFLQNDSIVIVNKEFLQLFLDEEKINRFIPIRFYAYNKTIIFFLDNIKIIFYTDDNIISKDEYQNKNIKNLIKLFYFQEEIKQKIDIPFQKNNNYYKINIVNKNLMKKYKEYYHYNQLYDLLKNNKDLMKIITEENNYINHLLLNDDIIIEIMRQLPKEYIELIQEKEILKKYMKNKQNNDIDINNNHLSKYLSDFEIINFYTLSSFKTLDFLGESKYYSGECFLSNGKISFIIQDNEKDYDMLYYQIGHLDDNDNIITDYYIDSNSSINPILIKNIFNSKSIDIFLKDIFIEKNSNSFILQSEEKIVCYCYKISNEEKTKDKEKNILKKNINEIANILLSIYIFGENLKKEIEDSISNKNHKGYKGILNECYLIRKDYLNEYKNLFLYDKISKYIKDNNLKNNENKEQILSKYILDNFNNYFKNLFTNKKNKKIENFFNNKNLYSLNIYEMQVEYNNKIYYPDYFELINLKINDSNFLSKEIKSKDNNVNKVQYIINEGKIIIKFLTNNCLIIGNMNIKNNNSNAFKSEILLNFTNREVMLSHFIKFIKNNYSKNISLITENESQISDIQNDYGLIIGKFFKLNINLNSQTENYNSLFTKDSSKNAKLKNYLRLLIKLIVEYESIKNNINKKINDEKNEVEECYYCINKKYIHEFNEIFKIKEVYNIINDNRHFFINYFYKFEESMISKLLSLLPDRIIYYFYNFSISKIKKLNNKSLYKLEYDEYEIPDNKKLKYFNDCNIINKNMILIFKEIDKDFVELEKYNEIKCLIGDKKLIMRLNFENSFIINVGHLNDDFIFISEYLIHSFLFRNLSLIFDNFKKIGFKYLHKYLTNNSIENIFDDRILLGTIYKLSNTMEFNIPNISGKILTLIIISIYQFILIKKTNAINIKNNNEDLEEVFLINNYFFYQYHYKSIFHMLNNNIQINQIILNTNFSINDIKKINTIINNLDINNLKTIEEKINLISKDCNISLEPKEEEIKISKTRNIKLYKEFIIINKHLLDMIENNFNVKYQQSMNFKLYTNIKTILIINNKIQNIILIGNYNNNAHFYNIDYILDYKNNTELIKETNSLIQEEYGKYLINHLIFNKNYENDYFSPIFDQNDNLVGFGYKYNDNINNDYSNYYFSNELISIIRLNIFYKQINNILNNKNTIMKDKFYLINEDYLKRFKNNNEYDLISEELINNSNIKNIINSYNNNEFKPFNMRAILTIIKKMKNDMNIYNKNRVISKKQYNSFLNFEPDKIYFNYYDSEKKPQYLTTYQNFEIVCFKFGKMFNEVNKILTDGIINNGKLIINLPNFLNDKDIWIIGKLNTENVFIYEYFLIYEQKKDSNNHINFICNYIGINNYLNGLNFISNTKPIVNEKENYKNIGLVIKIG